MKPVHDWDESDLQRFIDDEVEENTGIEFKAGDALVKNPKRNQEMCKDVSAMANAAGGVIVYGIVERLKGGPDRIGIADHIDGCDPLTITKDTIEQILSRGIEPRLQNVDVRRISLTSGRVAFTIEVPQGIALAPHQSRDAYKYFRRYNAQVLPMLDHEIRDTFKRATTPELHIKFMLANIFESSNLFELSMFIQNRSSAPALSAIIDIYIDLKMNINLSRAANAFSAATNTIMNLSNGAAASTIRLERVVKGTDVPIFRERSQLLAVTQVHIEPDSDQMLGFVTSCPGSKIETFGSIIRHRSSEPIIEFWPNVSVTRMLPHIEDI